jgi:crossover junction endodeoxyribonuclease RusA
MPGRSAHLVLPWPPSLNSIWRAVGGRVKLSEKARAYKLRCANALPTGRVVPFTGRLAVTMTLNPPEKLDGVVWDLANREKLLFDTLTEQRVWVDDGQIDALAFMRGVPGGAGCVELAIQEL